MEWKNYLELDPNHDIYNKCLLNMNENLGSNYPYFSNNNINYLKKYIPNYQLDNFQTENINKMNYYNIINNIQNRSSELYDLDENENGFFNPIDYEEEEEEQEKKLNKLSSDSTNNDNKETSKKNLFKIQTFSSTSKGDSKSKEFSNSDDNNNINNHSAINFLQNIPLKERMKIKKQKTKKLLENKLQRPKIDEESKENTNSEKNCNTNNSQEGNILNSILGNSNYNLNIDKSVLSKLSKKEIKMWRNRLSAQRSRDRKKKELIDLKAITKSLLQENEKLRNSLKERDDKINQLMNLLCPNCKNKLNGDSKFDISIKTNIDGINYNELNIQDKTQLTPSSIIGGKKKLALLMTGLFTIFCVFGTLINPSDNNLLRSLKEKGGNKNNTKINYDNEKRVNVPFLIEKDYTLRHKKEIEMYQKIKKFNLKNKNMMIPASVFTNNSEQIISDINNKVNNNSSNPNDNNTLIEEKKEENSNKFVGKNKFVPGGKIKIIEKEYSSKGNNNINEDENNAK